MSLTLVHALVCGWMCQGSLVSAFALETCLWDLLRDASALCLLLAESELVFADLAANSDLVGLATDPELAVSSSWVAQQQQSKAMENSVVWWAKVVRPVLLGPWSQPSV